MNQYIVAYVSTALVFALIDFVWLAYVGKKFYFERIGEMVSFNVTAAVTFYLIYIAGVIFFTVSPAFQVNENAWKVVLLMGCLFGFFCYATYDLTNLATLKDWSLSLVVVDIIWGTLLTGISATLGYLITRFFFFN